MDGLSLVTLYRISSLWTHHFTQPQGLCVGITSHQDPSQRAHPPPSHRPGLSSAVSGGFPWHPTKMPAAIFLALDFASPPLLTLATWDLKIPFVES